jgi:hypothetical protein
MVCSRVNFTFAENYSTRTEELYKNIVTETGWIYKLQELKRNLANNTVGGRGGGGKRTMGIRNFILQRSQIWKGGKLAPYNASFSFSVSFVFAIIQFSN